MNTHFETGSILTFTLMSLVAILFLIVWSLILAWPVQLLWNWLAPTIFGLGKITILQAFGLKLLLGFIMGRVSFNETHKIEE